MLSVIPPSLHPEGRKYQFLPWWNVNNFHTISRIKNFLQIGKVGVLYPTNISLVNVLLNGLLSPEVTTKEKLASKLLNTMRVTSPSRIILPIQRKQISSDGWMLNLLSKNVATITNPQGLRQTAYFSFKDKQAASKFLEKSTHNGEIERGVIRNGKYLSGDEVKTWGAENRFILDKALADIDAGNHLFQKKLGILQENTIMTYLFDYNGQPFRYKQVSSEELEALCNQLKQADWVVENGTKIAQFFNRIVKNK